MVSNVIKSYVLLFIHKVILFALTTNAIVIFIMYLYMYLLKSLYLLEFIVVYIFIEVDCIYLNCISTVFIEHICIYFFIYLFIFIGLDLIFFYSIHVLSNLLRENFILKEGHVILGKYCLHVLSKGTALHKAVSC